MDRAHVAIRLYRGGVSGTKLPANFAFVANLTVPGATIYYEVRGRGPTLVLIPGGPTDAASFDGIAAVLERSYTVVALDPRGNSRSKLDAPPIEQDLHVHADATAAVIAAVGN